MYNGHYCENLTHYRRRLTLAVAVGDLPLGGDNPIRVQSMANTLTSDMQGSVLQCIRIINAGADYVRFTIPSLHDVEAIAMIIRELHEQGYKTPIIADVHFNAEVALQVAKYVDKVRINPGNFTDTSKFLLLIEKCRSGGGALRIGVNHGSLSARIMDRFGDTPAGMAESAMEFLRICKSQSFDQAVVSMKSSNVRVMVQSNRLVAKMMKEEGMNFPMHLGVTEAGEGEDGRIKSAAGIGTLLADGLGDTIRISLTEEPEAEIPVARKLIEHIQHISQHDKLPDIPEFPTDPYAFSRRVSRSVRNIGGLHVPVVIGESQDEKIDSSWFQGDQAVDYIFRDSYMGMISLPDPIGAIMPYAEWVKQESGQGYPLLTVRQYKENGYRSSIMNLIGASFGEIREDIISVLSLDPTTVLVYQCTNANVQAELRWLHFMLNRNHCTVPVVIRLNKHEADVECFQLTSAADLGGSFIDGFGDGIWLSNSMPLSFHQVTSTAFGILQACRARITKTEFISCPSCGRTNFNLIESLARIKKATSHLKGLKIGIMGCIVNGPGEMADADYGYVGAGKGKITLYKSKEVIKRGIPEQYAMDELVNLIKENGEWTDPGEV